MSDVAKPRAKPRGRPFVKGQSGNPRGRPKEYAEMKALAREHTEAAMQALAKALGDERTAVAAAVALLDRGWGKPTQTVEASGPDGGPIKTDSRHTFDMSGLNDDELEQLERIAEKAAGSASLN